MFWMSWNSRLKALANEEAIAETFLQKHVSLDVSPFARTRNIRCGNIMIVSEKQKAFLIFFKNILFPQQIFLRLRAEETMFTGSRRPHFLN